MKSRREEAAVGAFVLVAAVIFIITLFAMGGVFRKGGHTFKTYFSFVGGLKSGQTVRFGGMEVGRVRTVRIDDQNTARLEVIFDVDASTPVRSDTLASISSLSPLGDNYLELSPGLAEAPLLPAGSEVRSEPYVGLNDVAARFDALMPSAQRLLEELTKTASEMRDLLNSENRGNIAAALVDMRRILEDGRPQIAQALGNIRAASGELSPLLDELRKTAATAEKVFADADVAVLENRADLREAVRSLRFAIGGAERVVEGLEIVLDANSGNLDETLYNLRIITDNFREFSDAIKARPASLIRGSSLPDRKPGERPQKR